MTYSIKAWTPRARSGFYEYGSKLPSFTLRKPLCARMGELPFSSLHLIRGFVCSLIQWVWTSGQQESFHLLSFHVSTEVFLPHPREYTARWIRHELYVVRSHILGVSRDTFGDDDFTHRWLISHHGPYRRYVLLKLRGSLWEETRHAVRDITFSLLF
mgnify:CR=1 FL=1